MQLVRLLVFPIQASKCGLVKPEISRLLAYVYPCQRFTLHLTVRSRMTRGQCDSLFLHRGALAAFKPLLLAGLPAHIHRTWVFLRTGHSTRQILLSCSVFLTKIIGLELKKTSRAGFTKLLALARYQVMAKTHAGVLPSRYWQRFS